MRDQDAAVEPLLIGKRECARALGVCVRTVENLIHSKELPSRKIGRRTLVPWAAVQQFVRRDHPNIAGNSESQTDV